MAKEQYWIGFDLGGTKMLATVYDSEFQEVAKDRKRTKGYDGVKQGVDRIRETIENALEKADVSPDQLGGVGIGVPGPVDLKRGVILEAANLGWNDVPLKSKLESKLPCPVAVLNDVDAGVYGEYRLGAAKGAHCVVGVFPGTGIGGGCVYDGKIFHGKVSSCMEIGHTYVTDDSRASGFGQQGVLESVASRLAIAAEASKAAYRGQAPNLMEKAGTDLMNIRSGAISSSIEDGDTAIEDIVRQAARFIGKSVANVVNLLAPDIVVLGGGLVEAMPEIMVNEIQDTAKECVIPSFADSFEVVAAELGDDASVMGAATWIENSVG